MKKRAAARKTLPVFIHGKDFELRYDFLYVIGRWKIQHITNAFQGY